MFRRDKTCVQNFVGNTYGKRLLASLFVHEGAKIGKLCDCCLEGDFASVFPV